MNGSESTDWVSCLGDERSETLAESLRELGLTRLQKYPVPKASGLPIGHEWLVARRFFRGASAVLYESALSGVYRAPAPRQVQDLFEALVLGRPLSKQRWCDALGARQAAWWMEQGLLEPVANEDWCCLFRVVPVDGRILLTDSQRAVDRMRPGANAVAYVERPIHEFVSPRLHERRPRALDVGPGAGMLALDLARVHDRCEAVELNPRAAVVTRFNARLNGASNCRVIAGDIFEHAGQLGRYETITWNTPFIFLPDRYRDGVLLAYGGWMGIEVTLRFVEVLPALLAPGGVTYLASAAPILNSGANPLIDQLSERSRRLGQDIVYHPVTPFRTDPRFADFYREHDIAYFETVFLEVRNGDGNLSVARLGWAERALNRLRRWWYSRG